MTGLHFAQWRPVVCVLLCDPTAATMCAKPAPHLDVVGIALQHVAHLLKIDPRSTRGSNTHDLRRLQLLADATQGRAKEGKIFNSPRHSHNRATSLTAPLDPGYLHAAA